MRSKTPSFVCEFEVVAASKDRRVLRSRMEAARQLFNAVLGEALFRISRMRQDPGFEVAKALPRGKTGEKATPQEKAQAKARQEAFAVLRVRHGFREFDLHAHPSLAPSCWIRDHLDVHACQKVATRAFKAVERWSYGQSGRPHFKRYGEVGSVEGKSNAAGIRFRQDRILWNGTFGNLALPLIVNPQDEVQAHALRVAGEGRVKYCRLLLRTIRGRERAFVQVVLEGQAFPKAKHGVGTAEVGLDLGPSQVAMVAPGHVETIPFCPDLDRKEATRKRYLRKLDRQRRANNPENFREDGTMKPRPQQKRWKDSRGMRSTRTALAELLRGMAAQRKAMQGALVHRVLAVGNQVRTENVNKRAWAKLWGRSVGHKAPGAFEARLKVLAKASGGSLEEIPTRTTFLSSRCLCGMRKKKPLSERRHICGCEFVPEGTFVDRDEFSAFLALHCREGLLDEQAARESWAAWGADRLLRSSSRSTETANREALPTLRGEKPRQSGSISNGPGQRRKAGGGKTRTGERRGIHPSKVHQPQVEQEGSHVA